MATIATGSINTSFKASLADNDLEIGQASFSFNEVFNFPLVNGVGVNSINQVWADVRTIAASGNDDINLSALVNALNGAINFSSIKGMMIKANAGNTNNLLIGNAATPFSSFFGGPTNTLVIPPNAMVLLANPSAAGYAVTPTTNNLLRVTNGGAGTTVTYQIYLYGVSA